MQFIKLHVRCYANDFHLHRSIVHNGTQYDGTPAEPLCITNISNNTSNTPHIIGRQFLD